MMGEQVAQLATDDAQTVQTKPYSTADAAWLAAIPCAVVLVAALLLLGPPLSDALQAATPRIVLLPGDRDTLAPEPREAASYVIAVGGVAVLALAILVVHAARPRLTPAVRSIAALGAQLLVVAFVIACFIGRHAAAWTFPYFSATTLAVAAALAVGLALLAGRSASTRRPRPRLASRARAWNVLMLAAASVAAAVWLLPGVNTEDSITWSAFHYDTGFPFDETFAVLNGLTPLADFNAQYASLLPYLIALPMLAFGKTMLVFTIAMCALSALAFVAIYDVLRRAARSATIGLALFLPTLATTLFDPYGVRGLHFTAGAYFGMMPLRYAGPYALAWLLARRLEPSRRARTWPLFAAAGLVWLNNFDFGLAALGATAAALLVTSVRDRRDLARLAASLAIGVLFAIALVAVLTLVRAGSLPDMGAATRYSRLYGLAGYSAAPMPAVLGVPLVIYLTYAAAIGTSVVRAIDGAPNRVLTGLLAWSGVFGLGAGSYYVARSVAPVMPFVFSAWALTLALLAVAVRETMAMRRSWRPSLPALAVLFGLGLSVCSIAQVPDPWREVASIQAPPPGSDLEPSLWSPPPPQGSEIRRFIASTLEGHGRFVSHAGAPVGLFPITGHRIADAYDVVDVVPFTGAESMHTVGELEAALDRLRDAGGDTVLLQAERVADLHHVLEQRGFRLLTSHGIRTAAVEDASPLAGARVVDGLTKWVDVTGRRS
jgi:hypothetical protein